MEIIRFENFSCFYKNKKEYITAIDGIDLSVSSGEFLVIVGESGCGKTTLLRSCLGLAEYYEGELFVDGVPVGDIDLKSGRYAYVSQDIGLYPNLTVYQNIAFPLRVIRTHPEEIDRRVKKLAAELGIELLLSRKPRQLSLGQQQRVAIARTLVKNPTVIYMDEPFSNLDPALRVELRRLVKSIHESYGVTVVFVTHDIGEALFLADRVVVMENGKIVESGAPDELKSEFIRGYIEQ